MIEFTTFAANYTTLTEFEFDGLSAKYGFADGHAYHDLDTKQVEIVNQMPRLWESATLRRHRDVEREFSSAFYSLANQTSVAESDNFRICTSASQSIDLSCAWAARAGKRIALVEPTFDNLALIVRRWGIPLQPVPEEAVPTGLDELDASTFDILFLVTPNNPTGRTLSLPQFQEVVSWCVRNQKTLFVDFCFRFFARAQPDYYRLLEDSGVDYVAIEDTGKTWATLDMKASLITYSRSLKAEIEEIFHEIFLGVSPFTLLVLTQFVNDTRARGLEPTLWKLVKCNRQRFREAIAATFLQIDPKANDSDLGLEWVRIGDLDVDDLTLTSFLKSASVACLPGRFFYWSLQAHGGHQNVRFSLLKPACTFKEGLPKLTEALGRHALASNSARRVGSNTRART